MGDANTIRCVAGSTGRVDIVGTLRYFFDVSSGAFSTDRIARDRFL